MGRRHEGYLAKQKDHTVSNVRLAKISVRRSIFRYIIRGKYNGLQHPFNLTEGSIDMLLSKKWIPKYIQPEPLVVPKENEEPAEENVVLPAKEEATEPEKEPKDAKKPKKKKDANKLSTKGRFV